MTMTVWYAHSKRWYGTEQEKSDVKILEFLGFEVVNPNQKIHQTNSKSNIKYFLNLVTDCDILAFRLSPDGNIGVNLAKEILVATNKEMSIIELPSYTTCGFISASRLQDFLKERIKPYNDEKCESCLRRTNLSSECLEFNYLHVNLDDKACKKYEPKGPLLEYTIENCDFCGYRTWADFWCVKHNKKTYIDHKACSNFITGGPKTNMTKIELERMWKVKEIR